MQQKKKKPTNTTSLVMIKIMTGIPKNVILHYSSSTGAEPHVKMLHV